MMLDYGEDVEGKLAGEREGGARQAPTGGTTASAPRWRGRTEAAHRCRCCARHRQKMCRCSKPTLNGARELDTKSRPSSSVWCGVAPNGGACPSCVALLRWRTPLAGLPSGRRSCSARLGRCGTSGHASRTPRLDRARSKEPRSRSGGGRKTSDQAMLQDSP